MSLSSTPRMWSPPLKRCANCVVVTLIYPRHRGLTNNLYLSSRLAAEELRLRGLGGAEDERSLTGFFLLWLSCSPPGGHFISLQLLKTTQVCLQISLICYNASRHPDCSTFVSAEEIIASLGLQGLQGEFFLSRRAGNERLSVLRFHKS